MKELLHINKENYEDYLNLDIIAFSFAFGGAQGSPGEIIVVTKDAQLYNMNYCYDNMTVEMCYEVCPPLKGCSFGMFEVEKTPIGWEGISLGAGNFLVLAETLYNQLIQEMSEIPPYTLYGRWINMVINKINTQETSN